MPKVDYEGLLRFLLQERLECDKRSESIIRKAVENLGSLFDHADSGVYPLQPVAGILRWPINIRGILQVGTDADIEEVGLVSAGAPVSFGKPGSIRHGLFHGHFSRSFGQSLDTAFEEKLKDVLYSSLIRDRLGSRLMDKLADRLIMSLRRSLRDSPWVNHEDSYGTSFRLHIEVSISISLFYYLGFALAGDKDSVQRLTPLINLLPHVLPIGEKKDKPGVWLVLAA